MSLRTILIAALTASTPLPLVTQASDETPPVIDVHMHAPMRPGPVESSLPRLRSHLETMDSLNVRFWC